MAYNASRIYYGPEQNYPRYALETFESYPTRDVDEAHFQSYLRTAPQQVYDSHMRIIMQRTKLIQDALQRGQLAEASHYIRTFPSTKHQLSYWLWMFAVAAVWLMGDRPVRDWVPL